MVPPIIFVITPGSRYTDHSLFWLYCLTNTLSTIYSCIWDYYMDWGLFRCFTKGKYGLREKISFSPNFYYRAIVINFILRFWWLVGVYPYPWTTGVGMFMKKVELMVLLKTAAEAIRRTIWALIRIENEFHNNFENYRTIPVIPKMMDDVEHTIKNLRKY